MTRTRRRLARTTASISAALALPVALVPPVGHFLVSYQYLVGTLDVQAEMSARTTTSLVMANPRSWQFEQVRLSELLQRRPLTGAPQVRRIVDLAGRLVAEYREPVAEPAVVRSHAIYDAGVTVGRTEVVQSLRPLLHQTLLVGVLSFLAGWAIYYWFGIHPRRVAEAALAALEESEHRYRSLYRSMKEGLGLFRLSRGGGGTVSIALLDANPALAAMHGVTAERLVGADETFFLGGALREHLPAIAQGEQTGDAPTIETAPSTEGRVYAVSIFYPQPGLFGALVEDLTEVQRAQAERERLERKMLEAQKLESLGVLAGGIAHDFNNLLVGILGNVDLALAAAPPESATATYLRRAEDAVERAADLASQMLAYSGRGRFVVGPIDLSQLVAEMQQLLASVVSKTAEVRYQLATDLPPIEADGTQLRQVVLNLITNASDAIGGREGMITVSTGALEADRALLATTQVGESLPEGRYAYLEVADTGDGMDAETLARIFDPFFTTRQVGRGLGLAAALGIVRGHRGTLSAQSAPGKGTRIRVFFPALTAERPIGPERTAEEGIEPPDEPSAGAILLVDDEPDVRTVAKDVLEAEGYTVWTAADGREAVDLFRDRHPEIAAVILDMTMPRMGGDEACHLMRGIAPEVPVILCSGFTERDVIRDGCSAAGFLQKPYRIQALLTALADVLSHRGPDARSPSG